MPANRSKISGLKSLARDRKAAALAEYVVILLLIGAAAAGATWKFGGEVRDIFLETAASLSGNGEDTSLDFGNDDATPPPEGGEDDGYGPKDRDPGGGVVDTSDVANGCPLTAGSEYYRAKHATQLQRWSWVILDPENQTGPMWGDRGGPWFTSTPSIFILLPSDITVDTYTEPDEPYFWTGSWWYKYTGRLEFKNNSESYMYRNCSDRSLDGPRRPEYDPPASSSTTAAAPSGSFQESSSGGGTLGFMDQYGDHDWYRVDMTSGAGSLRSQVKPTLVEGMPAVDVKVSLLDQSGAAVPGANSIGGAMMASSLPAGTYYLDVSNGGSAYGGMGGYVLSSGLVADTPETYGGATELFAGDTWVEDLPTGDAGDMFHITAEDGDERTLLVTATGAGDDPIGRVFVLATKVTNDNTAAQETLLNTNNKSVSYLFSHVTPGAEDYYFRLKNSSSYQGTYKVDVAAVWDVSPFAGRAQSLEIGTRFETRFYADNDVDMYRFDNPAAQQIRIEIFENNENNADNEIMGFTLYDQNMNAIKASSTSTNSTPGELIVDALPIGRYYIKAVPTFGGTSDYTILVDAVEDTPGSFDAAGILAFGGSHSEGIISKDDVDTFSFTNPAMQNVRLRAMSSGPSQTLTLTVYDKNQTQIASRSYNPDADLLFNDLPAGEYFARVFSTYGGHVEYILDVSAVDDTPGTFDGAAEILLGDTHSETIAVRLDEDMYHLINDAPRDVAFSISGASASTILTVYASDRATVVGNIEATNGGVLVNNLAAGQYYVHVTVSAPNTIDYSLSVQAVTDTPGTREGAREMAFGSTHEEDIVTFRDVDYYKVTISDASNDIAFDAVASQSLAMTIYDGSGAILKSTIYGTKVHADMTGLSAGTYYVSLTTRYDRTTDYDLSIGPVTP